MLCTEMRDDDYNVPGAHAFDLHVLTRLRIFHIYKVNTGRKL